MEDSSSRLRSDLRARTHRLTCAVMMANDLVIVRVIASLGLEHHQRAAAIRSKASELLRMTDAKLPAGALGAADCCRAAACVELACTAAFASFDRGRIVRASGAREKVYSRAVLAIQNVLGIRRTVDMRSLAVRFGSIRCIVRATSLLAAYKSRFIGELKSAEEKSAANFGSNVFVAAALYLAGRSMKVKIDKREMAREAGVPYEDLNATVKSMQVLCGDLLGTGAIGSSGHERSGRKRGRDCVEAASGGSAKASAAERCVVRKVRCIHLFFLL